MTGRISSSLVALALLASPAAASAQTTSDPTCDYTEPPALTTPPATTPARTTTTPTPTTPSTPTPTTQAAPTATTGDNAVRSQSAQGSPTNQAAAANTAAAPTGTTPTTLAYTGSEVWMVALLGLLAIVGGAALLRPSHR